MATLFRKILARGAEVLESSTEYVSETLGYSTAPVFDTSPLNNDLEDFTGNPDRRSVASSFNGSVTSSMPGGEFPGRRAPDPTAGRSRRTVTTLNKKHKNRPPASMKSSNPMHDSVKASSSKRSSRHLSRVNILEDPSLIPASAPKDRKSRIGTPTLPRPNLKLKIGNTLGRKSRKHKSSPKQSSRDRDISPDPPAFVPQAPEALNRQSSKIVNQKRRNDKHASLSKDSVTSDGLGHLKKVKSTSSLVSLASKESDGETDSQMRSTYLNALFNKGEKLSQSRTKSATQRSGNINLGRQMSKPPQTPKSGKSRTLTKKQQRKLDKQTRKKNKKNKKKQEVVEEEVAQPKFLSDYGELASGDFKFKQAMVDKYHAWGGVYTPGMAATHESDHPPMRSRKSFSFSAESPMILILGKSKAGKTTIFKQMMTLAGEPPNYARAYIPTKAPVEKEVLIEETALQVVDVGGSKGDVLNWRFYLGSAETILFVVALDEYDKLTEEGDKNEKHTMLQDSLELFESILRNVAMLDAKMLLVFNKADRFKRRLESKKVSLSDVGAYGDLAPTSSDYEESLEFISKMFTESIDKTEHAVHVEVTSAQDSEACGDLCKKVFGDLTRNKDVTKWKSLL